ncbi:lipase [Hoyosella rhizosphaerae]|uniref:Lipase n=1 Tax=Hoyosella rhizosphaerae TaxID=1755582 RepID=A0A916TYT0_9ACTN|nr:lipase family protein [Hoyosella rhizosphaerae]MBN4927206.1 lipase [Hoyosella rhizosphaerae]GGC53156.1 lipase [Hoyosella rhizosphaerae]
MPAVRITSFSLACVVGLGVFVGTPAASAVPTAAESGTVIEVSNHPFDQWIPGTAHAFRISYWSVGARGERIPVSGAVYLPEGTPPPGGWPVLAWAHGTVGLADDCAPSVTGRSERDLDFLQEWMAEGYAIVASDYAGLGGPGVHPYLNGEIAAYSVIDAVRAARNAEPSLSRSWVAVGQSQGGHAALQTANIARRYAPDLDFRGAVATGAPSQLEYLVSTLGPWFPDVGQPGLSTFVSYLLASVRETHPEANINSYLTPLGRAVVDDAERLCYHDQRAQLEGIALGALFTRQLTDVPFFSALREVVEVPVTGYERPVLIAQGGIDTTVWAPLTEILATQMRANQQPVRVHYYPADNHDSTMTASLRDSLPFVRELFR